MANKNNNEEVREEEDYEKSGDEEDIYKEEDVEEELEQDEIAPSEAGFMEGYDKEQKEPVEDVPNGGIMHKKKPKKG